MKRSELITELNNNWQFLKSGQYRSYFRHYQDVYYFSKERLKSATGAVSKVEDDLYELIEMGVFRELEFVEKSNWFKNKDISIPEQIKYWEDHRYFKLTPIAKHLFDIDLLA